jgi:hypothetical protein
VQCGVQRDTTCHTDGGVRRRERDAQAASLGECIDMM